MTTRLPSGIPSGENFRLQRGLLYGVIILTALIAFEAFNFTTTQHALSDLLGGIKFAGFSWASILAIAFCGIDFAGIARLFSPEEMVEGQKEVWYLFGAWLLAATMNAVLTWWGVSIALVNHQTQSSAVMDPGLVLRAVPIVVAVMVWLIRIMIIGAFSMNSHRLFSLGDSSFTMPGSLRSTPRRTSSRPAYPSTRTSLPQASFTPEPPPAPAPRSSYRPSHRPNHAIPAAPRPVTAAPVEPSLPAFEEPPFMDDEPPMNNNRRTPAHPVNNRANPVYVPPEPKYSNNRQEPTYHDLSAKPNRPNNGNSRPVDLR